MSVQHIEELLARVAMEQLKLTQNLDRTDFTLNRLADSQERQSERVDEALKELARETRRELELTSQKIREATVAMEQSHASTEEQMKVTDAKIREVGTQLGALGRKFGSFTEGMALPSMQKILTDRFQMDVIAPRVRARKDGRVLELDVLAFAHHRDEVYVVEVKSHLREDGLEQILNILKEFREFFPNHADKKVYGILAVVDAPEDLRQRVLREGIYLARIHDEEFELTVPDSFKPRAF